MALKILTETKPFLKANIKSLGFMEIDASVFVEMHACYHLSKWDGDSPVEFGECLFIS